MSTIGQKLTSGVFYTSIAKYMGILVSLVVTGVLSRIFTAEQFRDIEVVTVLIILFNIFTDIGIAPAIIQHKNLDRNDLSNIFSFTIWSGLVISLLFAALSGAIGGFYDSDVIVNICIVLSLNIFFAAANIVPNGLLYKEKRFRFIAIRSLAVQIVGGAAAITAAYSGAGIYALTINPIFSSIMLFIINFKQHPLSLRFIPQRESLRKVFSFSAYQFMFNIINYFTRNLDKILMGKYMPEAALGYYGKSYRLMMLPLQNITYVISPVMHPVFADLQHDLNKMAESYLKVVRFLAFIGLPLSVGLFFTGGELIRIIFGPQWVASIPAFKILALSVGIQIVLSTSGPIFQAANSTKVMFLSGLLSAIVTIGAILIGMFAFGTTEAVATGVCLSFAVNFVQSFYLLYKHTLRLPWSPFWRSFLSPVAVSLLMAGAIYAVGWLLPDAGQTQSLTASALSQGDDPTTFLNAVVSLAVKSVTGISVWIVYLQVTGIFDIVGRIKGKLRKKV